MLLGAFTAPEKSELATVFCALTAEMLNKATAAVITFLFILVILYLKGKDKIFVDFVK